MRNKAEFAQLRAPILLAGLVILAYSILVIHHLSRANWDPSVFIVAGDRVVNKRALFAPIIVVTNSKGYDGEYYYRLALNPFTTKRSEYGITIDAPSLRMQRIGYPFLAWVLSGGGNPALLSWVLIGLNLVGLGVIAAVSSKLALRAGNPSWLGLLPSFYPGFLFTLLRDTTEIVATAFAALALLFALRRSFWKAAPLWVCAILTRETTLLYSVGFASIAIFNMLKSRRWCPEIIPIAIPGAAFCIWQYLLFLRWRVLPLKTDAGKNIGFPFVGIWHFLILNATGHHLAAYTSIFLLALLGWLIVQIAGRLVLKLSPAASSVLGWVIYAILIQMLLRSIPFGSALHGFYIGAMLFCALVVCVVAATVYRHAGALVPVVLTWAGYAVLFVCLLGPVWSEPYSFLRAFSDCYVAGMILIIQTSLLSAYAASFVVGLTLPQAIWYSSAA